MSEQISYVWADEDDYAYTAKSQKMLSQSCKTSASISALLKTPGVWDPFVKSYVEVSKSLAVGQGGDAEAGVLPVWGPLWVYMNTNLLCKVVSFSLPRLTF